MSFSAPSAHQAGRIHLRGVPCPLWSAFVVGSTLTVCPPPDPAGLFRPAALLGFLTASLLEHCPEGQTASWDSRRSGCASHPSLTTEVADERVPGLDLMGSPKVAVKVSTWNATAARGPQPGDTLRSAPHPSRHKAGTSPGRVIEL